MSLSATVIKKTIWNFEQNDIHFFNLILWIKIQCVSLHHLTALPATQWDQDTLHATTVRLSRVGCVTTLHRRGTKVSCFHLQPCCSILKAFLWFLINASLMSRGWQYPPLRSKRRANFFFLKREKTESPRWTSTTVKSAHTVAWGNTLCTLSHVFWGCDYNGGTYFQIVLCHQDLKHNSATGSSFEFLLEAQNLMLLEEQNVKMCLEQLLCAWVFSWKICF